ncbi:hypothetical protein Micbo1qcDRAFT_11879 [Microdochium bolleyi]|uniref:Uncharacterized protein n=1 Tax=Microdochium bolleyi TaxID=196109 RepID=A0A136IWN3_9PEZI|nr:hypothetical protein Micbo1qcDRAFT_11879 [Microdochium bolleyi]
MSQSQTGPMLINIPPPGSNPDTPSDMPGTPTSTTTSLSAISTTAIKDGHRGHAHPLQYFGGRGHQHNPSTNSLEAERADRISRLAGLERVSTLRPGHHQAGSGPNQQTTPTSTGFPQGPHGGAPAYFDSNGQPTAANKMSTVGSASATASVGGRTTTEGGDYHSERDTNTEVDDDYLSNPSNYRAMDIDSVAGAIDQDEEMTNRSVGGYEDHMSDDGTASLVGFGEGANSTVSGPIYQRRPLPGQTSAASGTAWGLERSGSGLSEAAVLRHRELRENQVASYESSLTGPNATDRREARYNDGITMDTGGHHHRRHGSTNDDNYAETNSQGPIPVLPGQPRTSALREGVGGPASRESAAERLIRERLDGGESEVGAHALSTPPRGSEKKLGEFYFEN